MISGPKLTILATIVLLGQSPGFFWVKVRVWKFFLVCSLIIFNNYLQLLKLLKSETKRECQLLKM